MLAKTRHTNPDGSVVTIYMGSEAIIGNYSTIGSETKIGPKASFGNCAKIGHNDTTPYPITLSPMPDSPEGYFITITSKNMSIGCRTYPLNDWFKFDDRQILELDGKRALKFWRKYQHIFKAMAEAEGWLDLNAE